MSVILMMVYGKYVRVVLVVVYGKYVTMIWVVVYGKYVRMILVVLYGKYVSDFGWWCACRETEAAHRCTMPCVRATSPWFRCCLNSVLASTSR